MIKGDVGIFTWSLLDILPRCHPTTTDQEHHTQTALPQPFEWRPECQRSLVAVPASGLRHHPPPQPVVAAPLPPTPTPTEWIIGIESSKVTPHARNFGNGRDQAWAATDQVRATASKYPHSIQESRQSSALHVQAIDTTPSYYPVTLASAKHSSARSSHLTSEATIATSSILTQVTSAKFRNSRPITSQKSGEWLPNILTSPAAA